VARVRREKKIEMLADSRRKKAMNDFELESKLKSVPLPERTEDYWENFPSQVRVNLHRAAVKPVRENLWRPRVAWAGSFALAIALVFVCIQFHPLQTASVAINKHERHFRAQLAQLDTGLHVLMFNPQGMNYLLTEAN
jgi:hypothetical protein